MTFRIKAYTAQGLIVSKPFHEEYLAEDILFKSLCVGLDINTAYLSSPKGSKVIYSKSLKTHPIYYTRPDGTFNYGMISIRDHFEMKGYDYDNLLKNGTLTKLKG